MSKYKIVDIKYRFEAQDGRVEQGKLSDLIKKKGANQINCITQADTNSTTGTLSMYTEEVLEGGTKKDVLLLTQPAVELRDYETDLTDKVIELSNQLDNGLEEMLVGSPSEKSVVTVEDKNQCEEPDVDFALLDYQLVHNSLLDIRSCRTNIFIGTLGIIGAIAVGILSILGTNESSAVNPIPANASSWRIWILWASLVPIGLLVVAIMTTVHKTKSMSKRLSYLEVLGEYLRKKDFKIPHWSGWKKATRAWERCMAYDFVSCVNNECEVAKDFVKKYPKDESLSNKNAKADTGKGVQKEKWYKILRQSFRQVFSEKKTTPVCTQLAKDNSATIVKNIESLPNILHSFASLSMYIYIAILFISSAGLLSNLAALIQSYKNFSLIFYILAIGIGLVFGGFLTGWHLNLKSREKKLERTLNKYLKAIYIPISSGLILILFISLLMADYGNHKSMHWPAVAGYVLGATIAGVVVYSAYSFYRKLDALRRGQYSLERQRAQWAIMFKYCPLMDEETPARLFTNFATEDTENTP